MVACCKREHITWRTSAIFLAVIVVVLIVVILIVGLALGLRKCEQVPDLSVSIIYSNAKETELMNINGVRVFGMKDFTGNIQSIHAIQTFNAVYMMNNDRIIQIQTTELALVFNYNDTLGQYYVTAISENSSYEVPFLYYTPTVKFPEIVFDYSVDMNMSDPFTGIIIQMEDSLSGRLISDGSLQLNYYDKEYRYRSIVMISVGGGRYYALLPTNDNTMDKYFQIKNLHSTIFQQSNALIELIRAYSLADICSKISQTVKSFCDDISQDMNTKILDALGIASKYADRIALRSESSINVNSHFEVVIRMLGERVTSQSLDNIFINPNVRTVVPWNVSSSKGACNEQTVAGQDTPDYRIINIGKGHVAINFYYETFTVKDLFDVYYTGEKVFSSGCVSTAGERVEVIWLDGDEAYLRVNVTPDCDGGTGTQWYYAIECPNNELQCDEIHCYCGLKQKASRQIKEPTMDGCGNQRATWSYGSIHWLENYYNFTSVCNEHDRCYGTCNMNRLTCDNAFCSGLIRSCAINWNQSSQVNMCSYWAQQFCSYMADYGSGFFANAQNEDCSCEGESSNRDHDFVLARGLFRRFRPGYRYI
jgi:hypothetical protein